MACITGTGCAVYLYYGNLYGSSIPLEAAVCGAAVLGIAGERADASKGFLGTYHISLLDQLSLG